MKMLNSISFNEIDSSKKYFMFDNDSLSLAEISGKELIKLICDKYDYEDWKEEEIKCGSEDASVENFLEWSSDVNDDSCDEEWIRVYEK